MCHRLLELVRLMSSFNKCSNALDRGLLQGFLLLTFVCSCAPTSGPLLTSYSRTFVRTLSSGPGSYFTDDDIGLTIEPQLAYEANNLKFHFTVKQS